MDIVLIWIVMALACGMVASLKGRSFVLSLLGGLLVWPLVLLYQLVKPGAKAPPPASPGPEPFVADGALRGAPFQRNADGTVTVLLNGAPVRFRSAQAAEEALL